MIFVKALRYIIVKCTHQCVDVLIHQMSPNPTYFLHVCRYWIVTFPAEFNLDLGLIRMTEELRDLAAELGFKEHYKLIDISTM